MSRIISKYDIDNIVGHYPITSAVRQLVTAKFIDIATEEYNEDRRIEQLPSGTADIRIEMADVPEEMQPVVRAYLQHRRTEWVARQAAELAQATLRERGIIAEGFPEDQSRIYRKPTPEEKQAFEDARKQAKDAKTQRAQGRYAKLAEFIKTMAGVNVRAIASKVSDTQRTSWEEI